MRALEGKAVVITGAGAGLGAAYARHAASLGAAVVVNDLAPDAAMRVAAELTAAGARAIARPGDVSSWSFAGELVDSCVDAFGALDGLVNNAGLLRPAGLLDMSESDLRRMIDVNICGLVACATRAARVMIAKGRGSIINIASGSHAGDIGLGGYAATKGAVASLTYSWAMELADSGVRVNAVSPLAQTAMAQENLAFIARRSTGRQPPAAALPDPAASAPVVSFLLSERSAAINGQIVRITGDTLSLMTHPAIAPPALKGDWTFEAVCEAFADVLSSRQRPLGLSLAPA